ncbi:MAG: Cof-type HAD-IIB family hydrolase [Chloroflexota bacterium]|nr:Cof-type HAD-IIB family hydrolase [Chloroflexota bacterium]
MDERWLVATDLDGTLFDHSLQVSRRVERAISAALEEGHVVTLVTGRMYCATLPVAEMLKIDQPLICYQGALVRRGEEVIAHHTLPLDVAHDAIRFAKEQGVHLNAYVDDRLFVAERTPEAEFYRSLSPNVVIEPVGDLLDFLVAEPTKLVFVQSEEETARLLPIATERWGQVAQVVRSHPRFVELTHPGASKGRALLELAASLGIPRERTLAVGDNLNDLTMIQAAGVGVAMGNAAPELKEVADWVAPPISEDGLAVAIERFALNDKQQ